MLLHQGVFIHIGVPSKKAGRIGLVALLDEKYGTMLSDNLEDEVLACKYLKKLLRK
ncbi:hypothetical protein [Halobacillus litoralis]|uniref:hypothetical protein n=1 Tax=Halobacillus litoralis TaxID=45668 RepID=UPI001CFC79AE|nr:hypothetical protein [Halobacillus litoralis]